MGEIFGGGSPKSEPAPVIAPPPPPPPVPTDNSAADAEQAAKERQIAIRALGRQETIKTSNQGDTSTAQVAIKKLTGQ